MRKSEFRFLTLVLLLAGFAGTVQNVAGNTQDASTMLSVHVRNYAHVDAKTLAEAEKVASEIFRHAHVEARWVDEAIASSPEIKAEDVDGQASLGGSQLWLDAMPGSMADALSLPVGVMGLAPGSGPDRQTVYVFYNCVEALAQRQVLALTKGDISRPATRGQIFGHMIAHEIGHLLLNLPSHSDSGIMRGSWDLKDLEDVAFGSLFFTPAQAAVIRAEVARRARQSGVEVAGQNDFAR